MEYALTIVLLDSSLLMEAVAACLADEPALRLVRISNAAGFREFCFTTFLPDFVLFELGTVPDGELLGLATDFPGIRWVGLDPYVNQVSVFTSRRHETLTCNDLLRLIREIVPEKADWMGAWTAPDV